MGEGNSNYVLHAPNLEQVYSAQAGLLQIWWVYRGNFHIHCLSIWQYIYRSMRKYAEVASLAKTKALWTFNHLLASVNTCHHGINDSRCQWNRKHFSKLVPNIKFMGSLLWKFTSHVSCTCRKYASCKSAGKFPTKCTPGLTFSRLHVMCRKHASCTLHVTFQKTQIQAACFLLTTYVPAKPQMLELFLQNISSVNCRVFIVNINMKSSYKVQETLLHKNTRAGRFPALTVKAWSFLSCTGNIILTL